MENITLQSKISLKDNLYADKKHRLWCVNSFDISLSLIESEKEIRNIVGLKRKKRGLDLGHCAMFNISFGNPNIWLQLVTTVHTGLLKNVQF